MSEYAASGVDIAAGNRAVALMKAAVTATHGPEVLAGVGSFGGLFDAGGLKAMESPVLVASTDGVGTKVALAAQLGQLAGIGHDLVNHCVNDILVQGARPLFFMDYIAAGKLHPDSVAEIVGGMADACSMVGCALLGGETAEMPGVYAEGAFDVAGTVVGVVEKGNILPRGAVHPGDVLIGLASSGPHTNGYSLIRRLVAGQDLTTTRADLGGLSLGMALLTPHRNYLPVLRDLLWGDWRPIKALAHITGGGFVDNLPRCLPEACGFEIDTSAWPRPALFAWLVQFGKIDFHEAYFVFNMGIGMVAVVAAEDAARVVETIGTGAWIIGRVTDKPGQGELK